MQLSLYILILLLTSLAGAISFSKGMFELRPLVILLAYTYCHEWLVHSNILPNTRVAYWVYSGVSFALYIEFIRRSLKNKLLKTGLLVLSICFVLVGLYGGWNWSTGFPSQFVVSGIPFIVIGCLLVLYHMLRNISEQSITENPIFICTAAIFIYQSVAFVYLGCVNYLMNQEAEIQLLHSIHRWTSILFYATLGYAFLLSRWNSRKLATT